MRVRQGIVVAMLVSACGMPLAIAQAQTPSNAYQAHEQDNSDGPNFDGARPTAPAVGVSNLGVVAAGTRYLSLFSKAHTITPLDERGVDDTNFPFVLAATSGTRLIDPRAAHDPIHNRLWALYGEAKFEQSPFFGIQHCEETALLHLSVNKAGANFGVMDPLDGTQWWYYTGSGGSAGNGGEAFNLRSGSIQPYQTEPLHEPLKLTARMPSIGFHSVTGNVNDRSGAVIVATNAREVCTFFDEGTNGPPLIKGMFQFLYVIPYEHDGGTKSILDGDRPDESDITVVRPFLNTPFPLTVDTSIHGWVVQAPYEQVENATFIISTPNPATEIDPLFEHVRLKGLFYDDTALAGREWTLQQRVTPGATPILDDIPLDPSLSFLATNLDGSLPFPIQVPVTPDTTTSWIGPKAQGTYFHSAVLAKDVANDFRIFAVHAVRSPSDDRWVVQWYVIDPDLANFHSATHGVWSPDIAMYTKGKETVEASGRLEDEGHSYHPVIVVNRQGQAFIEYTYSDGTTWPQIRRVRLNSTYDDIVGTPSVVRAGPPQAYVDHPGAIPGNWANTADAQADPFNSCAYWSTHTLVNDLVDNVPDPTTEKRDVWLFHQAYANSVGPLCLQTLSMLDLNDDGVVDALDLAALTDLYARGARRIDLNADGVTDRHDLELYMAAYEEYTRR